MLPFKTNIILCVIEFFSVVLLHVAYALSQDGPEKAAFISIGFLPALLTILLYRLVKNERIVIRCFYLSMIATSYIISWQLGMLGTLSVIFLAGALMLALYANLSLMIEYATLTIIALILNIIFLSYIVIIIKPYLGKSTITILCPIRFFKFIRWYCFFKAV